jgi:hypothetical protein
MHLKKRCYYGFILLAGLLSVSCAQKRHSYVKIIANEGYLQKSAPPGVRFSPAPVEAEYQPVITISELQKVK